MTNGSAFRGNSFSCVALPGRGLPAALLVVVLGLIRRGSPPGAIGD